MKKDHSTKIPFDVLAKLCSSSIIKKGEEMSGTIKGSGTKKHAEVISRTKIRNVRKESIAIRRPL